MPPFAESQEQDPIIMATGYDDSSVITDDSFFDKPTQNGNTAIHDVTTKKETSKVVLSFYDVMMDFNLCCSTRHHDDDETVVAGSKRKTSCKYAQAEISLPHKKYNNNKIQEEENKEDVEVEQEKMMSTNNNTMEYEKNKKKLSRVNRTHNKSTLSMQKVNNSSRQSTTTTTTHLSSSYNQKEKKSNMTDRIQKSLSLQKKIKSLRKTMSKASMPTNKKMKKTASVMMTNGTFSFKKTKNRNRNRNKKETSPDSNTVGLSSFIKQMHRMGYSRSVTTKQNHAYNEIRAKLTQ